MNFVAIDFETANQYRTSACSLGITIVKNNVITDKKEWLIRPEPFEFSPFNTQIHGICADDVKSAPTFKQLWPEISHYFNNQIVVAHNAAFDVSVLRRTLEHYDIDVPNFNILCTYRIAESLFPNAGSHRLNIICNLMNISLNHHNALSDSAACAEILLKIICDNNLQNMTQLKQFCNITPGFFSQGELYKPCRIRRQYHESDSCLNSENNIEEPLTLCIDDDFKDKAFVFTGTLLSMNRAKALEIVTRGGGIAQKSLNKSTDFLVVGIHDFSKLNGHAESSKMRKAYELQQKGSPLRVICEDEFVNLIDDELYALCFYKN